MTHYWITKDKRKLDIKEMETDHLRNTIAMLQRNAEHMRMAELAACFKGLMFLQGEMACDSVESEIRMLESLEEDEVIVRNYPSYYAMIEELASR